MECDSTHAAIERRMKNRDFYLQSQFVQIIKEARVNPRPYTVHHLTHTYFQQFDDPSLIKYTSIRLGKKLMHNFHTHIIFLLKVK